MEVLHSRHAGDCKRKPFKSRVADIISPLAAIFGGQETARAFATRIAHTRNYLVHYNPAKRDQAVPMSDLPAFISRTEALCELHLLKCIGLPIAEIEGLIARKPRAKGEGRVRLNRLGKPRLMSRAEGSTRHSSEASLLHFRLVPDPDVVFRRLRPFRVA